MTNWTDEQLAFIEEVATTNTSLRLDAVAGSGKTTTLLHAARGLPPTASVIALAFNKNIADELSKKFPSRIVCKTLNSVGNAVWLAFAGKKALDSRKMGDLTSQWCKKNLTPEEADAAWNDIRELVSAIKSQGFVPHQWEAKLHKPAPILSEEAIESICIGLDIPCPKFYIKAVYDIMLTSISEAFTTRIDFDDQIYMATYFADDKSWPTYDVVMVDEAQDLSTVQHDMVERLGAGSRLIVVGDERQAIYGWRGASCHSLRELEERFNLKRMPLTVSFRCPSAVIDQARKIVRHIQAYKIGGTVSTVPAHEKVVVRDEDGVVLGEELVPRWYVEDLKRGSVVLCRNNAPLIKLGFALIRAGIPSFFTGKDISKGLIKIVKGLDEANILQSLAHWYDDEQERLRKKEKFGSLDALEDKYEALCAIYSGAQATNKTTFIRGIEALFKKERTEDCIELSTIHKAKGKEWETVYFLNEHLIPGKWIQRMVDNGVPGSEDILTQEDNLRYVAITRSLDTLKYLYIGKDEPIFSRKGGSE